MRPQHHVQPLTNHQDTPKSHMSDIAAKQQQNPTAATHQPPATETALEGAQEPSKTLGLGASARCISSMGIFHFSDEGVKGARRRRGKPRLNQHMRSNLEAAMRASDRPRQALERLECQQTYFIMAPKTGSKN